MKQNRFKIVIPSYNNEKWYEYNLASILNQTYTNYEVLYIDDKSTDNTYQLVVDVVGDLPNWKVVTNNQNMRRGYNLSPYNPLIIDFMEDDQDILLFVDGDDWLYDENVLAKLNDLYNDREYWMTYGKFVCYPTGAIGHPQNTDYPTHVHSTNNYRKDTWRASHLRTFRWHLYKQIKREDLIYTKTGEFYYHAEDLATSFPCLEMCPRHKIGVVDFMTYVYNVSEENRDRVENDKSREPGGYQYELGVRENEVRSRTPYKTLEADSQIVSVLGGGLGNMLFQTAAAKAMSLKFNKTLLLNPNHTGVLHKLPTTYTKDIFRNIPVLATSLEGVTVPEESFTYKPLNLPNDNVILTGYFQSPRYFKEYKSEILEMFKPTEEIISQLQSRYPILKENVVSIHVRRGDYTTPNPYHPVVSDVYLQKSIEYFSNDKYQFVVFSDDLDWCKDKWGNDDRFSFFTSSIFLPRAMRSSCVIAMLLLAIMTLLSSLTLFLLIKAVG